MIFRTRGVHAVLLLAILTLVPGLQPSIAAQRNARIEDPPRCAECRLTLDRVVTLAGDHVGEPRSIARMSNGRWLVTTFDAQSRLLVFDSAGKFLNGIGRRGQGPGEFTAIGMIRVGSGDTVRVFDLPASRTTTFSPTLGFVRTTQNDIVRAWDVELLSDGRMLAAQSIPSAERAGLPLHLLDRDGRLLHSFGAETPQYQFGKDYLVWRIIAPEPDRKVWSAHVAKYVLELWDFEGVKLRELIRDVPWFKPHTRISIDYKNLDAAPPNPIIQHLRRDSNGLLWVVILVPDAKWKSAIGPVKGIYGRAMQGVVATSRYYDTVIEIIDPVTATLVTSSRFDQELHLIDESNFVFSYREDEMGVPNIDVFTIKLTRNPRR